MKKTMLLPRMAIQNLKNNANTYLPYILASVFGLFTYFSFDLLMRNDIMKYLPKAAYAYMLLAVGRVLLMIILVPFLYYTNSFLIKRRKSELGLYSVLGMEKKHMGGMLFLESLLMYGVVVVLSTLLGVLFGKLIFLILLNVTGMPVDCEFRFSVQSVLYSMLYYGVICLINLFMNLVQVGKASPVELLSGSSKGEKEPKHLWVGTVIGLLLTGGGYYLAIIAKVDMWIYTNFFFAVLLVVVGTHFLFTSTSITFLKFLKRNRRFYYKRDNFTVVSGMLYRMKKNAASLANICVFSAMVMITFICTVCVVAKVDEVTEHKYPYEFEMDFQADRKADREAILGRANQYAEENKLTIKRMVDYEYASVKGTLEGESFRLQQEDDDFTMMFYIELLTVEDMNRLQNTEFTLNPGEVVLFTNGEDYGSNHIRLMDTDFTVKAEIESFLLDEKHPFSYSTYYLLAFCNRDELLQVARKFGNPQLDTKYFLGISTEGAEEDKSNFYYGFVNDGANQTVVSPEVERILGGLLEARDNRQDSEEVKVLYGTLVFIGIFFGAIFVIFMLLILYYKQIVEGYEDKRNYEIMAKVGMSDEETRQNISKQIKLTFLLPLAVATIHTLVGMNMVKELFITLELYDNHFVNACTLGVCVAFAIFYGLSYKKTAKAYYKIVKH